MLQVIPAKQCVKVSHATAHWRETVCLHGLWQGLCEARRHAETHADAQRCVALCVRDVQNGLPFGVGSQTAHAHSCSRREAASKNSVFP